MAELQKIIDDPIYFAEKYFYIITGDEGKRLIKVYPKQAEMIRGMCSYQRFICLSARQTGKCISRDTAVKIRDIASGTEIWKPVYEIFEAAKSLGEVLDREDKKKFIEAYCLDGYEVFTDTGWKKLKGAFKTRLLKVYEIKTKNHYLLCAGKHIVYKENMKEAFAKDLKAGDMVATDLGLEEVLSAEALPFSENMFDLSIDSEEHRYYANGILSHNSTSYTIFALWYALTNKDKTVLICANRFATAKDILARIKLAYTELPSWLKPGIKEWNRSAVTFDNGCKIVAEATSANSGRGSSINVLVLDEFAFIAPNIESEFLQSVFPVVSSSKTSKIIIVSTPNGMGNEFYNLWNRATLNIDDDVDSANKWHYTKVDWFEVPGRDENWKQKQLETFGNNLKKFEQEYGCSFLGSSETLIDPDFLKEYKDKFIKQHAKRKRHHAA